ncbi:HEAT repeat protein-like protein [Plenodomus tracheiphilus IPT5]|uniref:HEAT repeat protein-like protein n=1 Tax=Plenodomus tracheiphilus IPT5 TaxID=1408161 RepID=A0A6A7AR77_9PLEO|nr:HEAT repeat protein-like protein [Plenodomus tracheiphilus IPT5]
MDAEFEHGVGSPVPEKVLRELARSVDKALPNVGQRDSVDAVKQLHKVIDPVLETADIADLDSGHRAAASNALCAIVDHCRTTGSELVCNAVLEDSIWLRIFQIYLHRSGEAKGKSMRQILVTLTNAITKDQSPRACALRKRAAGTFLDIICERQDRFKVKPALQGLAHLLLKKAVSIAQLVHIYDEQVAASSQGSGASASPQTLFNIFLGWIVHHETALSAGHLIRNFLVEARRLPDYSFSTGDGSILPLWIAPVIQTLRDWPDRLLEFKTHVFPHCFLPNIDEYLRFLSVLDFATHVQSLGTIPVQLRESNGYHYGLSKEEQFKILLATIESGKELSVIRDVDRKTSSNIEVHEGALFLPDTIFAIWMSHAEPEVRLAGMFLSIYSVSVTKPLNYGVLRALKQNLVHLHADTDPYFRREVLGNTQRLFDRLRACTATAARAQSKAVAASHSRMPIPSICYGRGISLHRQLQRNVDLGPLAFLAWYLRFLERELRPTATYQRRITALRALTIVLRSGLDPGVPKTELSKSAQGQLNWAHGVQIANSRLVRVLLDLVLDAFDDVRDTAVSVLQLCLTALPQSKQDEVLAIIPGFLQRAETLMLRTGRADQADGVARAYGLIFTLANNSFETAGYTHFSTQQNLFGYLNSQLKETLKFAHSNLSEAVNGRPVHGTFAALTYIVDQPGFYSSLTSEPQEHTKQWLRAHTEVLDSIDSLWSCVHHVLCADAPEGHVPDEIEDEVSLDTKEILSYSWRGLKEASTLLRTIVTKAPIGHDDCDFLTPELFEQLGRLCFTQLLELRHRGAFSTVSQTFAAFCRRCVTSKIPALQALPEVWYQDTLRSIQDKADAITRRSAGIPALMTALLAAGVQPGSSLFSRAMQDLTAKTLVEAKSVNIEESRLPQVHALNCIKEIFTTSKLSVASEAYIGQGLELAARMLNSEIWPIRNCSLMLFKALIERLLGSDEAQDWKERERAKTSRFSYDFFPTLPKMLSDLLDPNGPLKKSMSTTSDSTSPFDLHGAEGVFPALQILRQARPPQPHLVTIQKAVTNLLSSPHWHLRDMAARTAVSMRPINQLYAVTTSQISTVPSSTNQQHGVLLTIKYMYIKLLRDASEFSTEDFGTLMKDLGVQAKSWYSSSDCPFIRSAFLDIVAVCGLTMLRRTDTLSILPAWQELTDALSIGPEYALGISGQSGDSLYEISLARVFFIDRLILRDDMLSTVVSEDYQGIGEALMLLATDDADTCCATLETLDTIIRHQPTNDLTIPIALVIAPLHNVIVHATDLEVLSKAQAVLAAALQDDHLRTDFFNAIRTDHTILTLEKLESQCLNGPPSNMQSALHLQAFFLDHAYNTLPNLRRTILPAIARYIRLLRKTIIDTNPFDTRYAAIQSLTAIPNISTASPLSPSTGPLILALALLLHTLLSDDDDEIRFLAAKTTHTFLLLQSHPPSQSLTAPTPPIPTTNRLTHYLCTTFPSTSPPLLSTALRNLTNTPPHHPLFSTPFSTTLAETRKQDSALFATEKQNLYHDPTLDTLHWIHILKSTTPPRSVSAHLSAWILSALTSLTDTLRSEGDGALGWCSKSEVFALVGRVLGGVDVLFAWGVVEWGEILVGLARFEGVGGEKGVHGLVLQRVRGILGREVLRSLGKVEGSLRGVGVGV